MPPGAAIFTRLATLAVQFSNCCFVICVPLIIAAIVIVVVIVVVSVIAGSGCATIAIIEVATV